MTAEELAAKLTLARELQAIAAKMRAAAAGEVIIVERKLYFDGCPCKACKYYRSIH